MYVESSYIRSLSPFVLFVCVWEKNEKKFKDNMYDENEWLIQ